MSAEHRYDSLFRYYATHNPIGSVDWLAIKAQAIAESALDPFAKSAVGASGLMQFMATTWAEWWQKIHPTRVLASRTDAERSIELGCCYMADLVARFRDIHDARAAYNWGMGNLRRHIATHGGKMVREELPAETQGYLGRIERIYERLLRSGDV